MTQSLRTISRRVRSVVDTAHSINQIVNLTPDQVRQVHDHVTSLERQMSDEFMQHAANVLTNSSMHPRDIIGTITEMTSVMRYAITKKDQMQRAGLWI